MLLIAILRLCVYKQDGQDLKGISFFFVIFMFGAG